MKHRPQPPKQLSFASYEFAQKKRVTRREKFLAEMEQVVPWTRLEALIEPLYPTSGRVGSPSKGVPLMLRMYFLQQWFGLADQALEDAIYDSQSIREFTGIDLSREAVPDATTLLKFRRLLEQHGLTAKLFECINADLAERGLLLREGTIAVTNSSIIKTVGVVFTALCLIIFGDAAGKMLTTAGVSPFFVAWSRFGLAAVLLFPIFGQVQELRSIFDWRILLRASFIVGGVICILTALRTEPMANVFGAFFIGPVVSYFLAALLLKEKITAVRTTLLLLGFFGVILVVKPGFGFTPGIAFALAAGCLHGAYLVATRWLAGRHRPTFLLISQLIAGAIVLLPFGLSARPTTLSMTDIFLVCVSAIGSAAGNYLLVIANRTTPASLISPLIYTQLVAATAVGYLVFSDWPTALTFTGLTLVLASGLLSLWFARSAK